MRLSSIWLDLCSPRPKTAPGAKCSISLHDLWRRTGCTTQRVQAGSARACRSLSTGVVWKRHCPAMGSHRKDCRAYHTWLCPGGQGRAPSVSPCPQWMGRGFTFLARPRGVQLVSGRFAFHQNLPEPWMAASVFGLSDYIPEETLSS